MNKILYIFCISINLFAASNIIKDKYGYEYKTVISPFTGKIWLDRNLGATEVCKNSNDKNCFGDYFQWGRYSDGHEKFQSGQISNTVINTLRANHTQPIINFNQSGNWTFADTTNAWKGMESINNPCPIGFRIPTKNEIISEKLNNPFLSFLKIPSSGSKLIDDRTNQVEFLSDVFNFWSSDICEKDNYGTLLPCVYTPSKDLKVIHPAYPTDLIPVRCIKD